MPTFALGCGTRAPSQDIVDIINTVEDVVDGSPICAIPKGAPVDIQAAIPRAGLRCTRIPVPLIRPRDVIETSFGEIWVTESNRGRIVKLVNGTFEPVVTQLITPIGLRELPDGRVVVAEEDAHRVSAIDPRTHIPTVIAENLNNVTYISLGRDNRLFVSSFTAFAPTGIVWSLTLGLPVVVRPFATEMNVPEGSLLEMSGELLVAEWNRPSRVIRFSAQGGSASTASVVAQGFTGLFGLARAPDGGFLIADHNGTMPRQGRIVHVHPNGTQEIILSGVVTPGGMNFTRSGDLLLTEHSIEPGEVGYVLRISGW